ncbi:hypothetical protein [Fusobacterium ulcerans]|nr:hypothetical protein [Fusobacterium ulcerans]
MALTIQERLKNLCVEHGLMAETACRTDPPFKSALSSYEVDDFMDISHYALIKLEKFYGVTADYLQGLTTHPNANLTALLCELVVHPDFMKLRYNNLAEKKTMADPNCPKI